MAAIARSNCPCECGLSAAPPPKNNTIGELEKNMDYKNSFVLYESVYAQYDRLMRRGKV